MSVGMSPSTEDAGERLGVEARGGAAVPAFGVADEPPVALGAERSGADQDRVDALAQAVEHLPVARVAEPARDAPGRRRGRRRSRRSWRSVYGRSVCARPARLSEASSSARWIGVRPRARAGGAPGPARARGGGHGAEPISRVINKQPCGQGRFEGGSMLDCTYRVQIPHHAGQLARVAQAIADGDGLIGDVVTVSLGREHSVRDITVEVRDIHQSDQIAELVGGARRRDGCCGTRTGRCFATSAASSGSTPCGRCGPFRRCATCTRPGSRACAPRSPSSPRSPPATR